MIEIPVNVCGDHWCNSDEIDQHLAKFFPGEKIHIKVNTEGPSLKALGVTDVIERFCKQHHIPLHDVSISGWCNEVETLPFVRITRCLYSHFYFMSEKYWQDHLPEVKGGRLFGLFVGRSTIARQMITWHVWNTLRNHCLFSVMKSNNVNTERGIALDRADEWHELANYSIVKTWWDGYPIASLDNKCVRDQYDPSHNTNRDLLTFYDQFYIELVCETYTRGQCFFPTEKTVRPMVGLKPMFVYGPRHYLQHLHNQGFRTWSSIWNEDYDEHEGAARWYLIKKELDRIVHLDSNQQQQLLRSALDVAIFNKAHLLRTRLTYAPK